MGFVSLLQSQYLLIILVLMLENFRSCEDCTSLVEQDRTTADVEAL